MNKNSGFSLVGVLISAFASMIVILAIMSLLTTQMKATKNMTLDMISAQFTMEIGRLMRTGTECTSLLTGLNIGTAASFTMSPSGFTNPPTPLKNVLTDIGSFSPHLTLTGVMFEKVDTTDLVSPIEYKVSLLIQKDRNFTVGATSVKRLANIVNLDVVGGTIQNPACLHVDGIAPAGPCQTIASPPQPWGVIASVSCPAGWTMTGGSCMGVDECSGSDSSQFGGQLSSSGINCPGLHCTRITAYVRCCQM